MLKEKDIVVQRYKDCKTERQKYISLWNDINKYVSIATDINTEFEDNKNESKQRDRYINDRSIHCHTQLLII